MPVRSLTSSVLKWPDLTEVAQAVRSWADRQAATHVGVLRIGYFGSYARGDWGPGSDVDLLVIVADSDEPFERRAARWDATDLPVPADVLVYTIEEWQRLDQPGSFNRTVMQDAVWVYPPSAPPDASSPTA